MMEEDLFPDLSNEDYHDDHNSYSKTNLSNFDISPKYMQYMRNNPVSKPAWDLGTATHTFLLQPELWRKEIVIMPAEIKTRRGKAWEEFKAAHKGMTIITKTQSEEVLAMVDAILANPIAEEFITTGIPEVSVFQKAYFELDYFKGSDVPVFNYVDSSDPVPTLPPEYLHSIMLKARPDVLHEDKLVDLKTAKTVAPKGFGKDACNYRYHWSAWLSLLLLERYQGHRLDYYFVAVENKPPHDVATYHVDDDILDLAEEQIKSLLPDLARCDYLNEWPGIQQQVHPLEFPRWAFSNY